MPESIVSLYLWDVLGYNIEVEVEVEHDLHVRRIESRPLSLSAMATLVQVASVWRYKYLFRLFFSKTNLNLWYCSTDWNFGVVEIGPGWRIILEQDRKKKCFVLFLSSTKKTINTTINLSLIHI